MDLPQSLMQAMQKHSDCHVLHLSFQYKRFISIKLLVKYIITPLVPFYHINFEFLFSKGMTNPYHASHFKGPENLNNDVQNHYEQCNMAPYFHLNLNF